MDGSLVWKFTSSQSTDWSHFLVTRHASRVGQVVIDHGPVFASYFLIHHSPQISGQNLPVIIFFFPSYFKFITDTNHTIYRISKSSIPPSLTVQNFTAALQDFVYPDSLRYFNPKRFTMKYGLTNFVDVPRMSRPRAVGIPGGTVTPGQPSTPPLRCEKIIHTQLN